MNVPHGFGLPLAAGAAFAGGEAADFEFGRSLAAAGALFRMSGISTILRV